MKVLAIGGATIDTIVSIADRNVEQLILRNADAAYLLLEVGRKIEAEDISVHCGGGAVNAAVAMSRLGHETSVLVKLGRDFRADVILSRLAAEGITTCYAVRDENAPTGTSVFVSAHDRNTAVITFRGTNSLITSADLDGRAFAVDLVYVAGLSDASADYFPEIVERANAAGALVAANPGIRQLSTRQEAFRSTLGKIDILAINRHEATALVPWLAARGDGGAASLALEPGPELPDLARRGFSGNGSTMTLARFFKCLMALGPRWIVVTDGKDGAYIGSASGITYCPALPVGIIGTAGAGDAFNATFSAFILMGSPADEAAAAAAINSASVVNHLDTQTGLLTGKALAVQVAEQRYALRLRHWSSR
ncbi:MAG: carbohydrate kinase family protein [Alphaproteobacteria bacterium]|nr:carbohydrate kinase family protein [Alphaproteobacteria bacterium]